MNYEELPHDDVLEKGVLSVLLFFPERFQEVSDLLVPTDFYTSSHQQIWMAMTDLFKQGKEIDLPNIRLQLQKQTSDPRPSLEALADAMNEDTRGYHLQDFVKEIKNKSLLRQIIRMSKSHAYSGGLKETNAKELLGTIEKDTLSLLEQTRETAPVDAQGILDEVENEIANNINTGYNTGFHKLDDAVGGFIPSQVWIVGAYTGVGKTFLILQFLLNVLKQGGKVVLFSTEMDRKLNMLRMLGNLAELGTIKMLKNSLNDIEIEQMKRAKKELASYKDQLTIYDDVYTVEEIRLKTKKLLLSKGVDVVAVDYIQNLRGGENIYERMSVAAVELYRVAQELKVTMLIGSQISQDAASWKSKESIDFKGAGEIAAVADVALWIKKKEGGDREVLIRKARHGLSNATIYSRLEFPSGRFTDTDKPVDTKEDKDDIRGQLEQ